MKGTEYAAIMNGSNIFELWKQLLRMNAMSMSRCYPIGWRINGIIRLFSIEFTRNSLPLPFPFLSLTPTLSLTLSLPFPFPFPCQAWVSRSKLSKSWTRWWTTAEKKVQCCTYSTARTVLLVQRFWVKCVILLRSAQCVLEQNNTALQLQCCPKSFTLCLLVAFSLFFSVINP
jgi:hypothetical protein